MTYLESLNKSLKRLMRDSEDVYLLGEDIVDPYGGAFKVTKGLSTLYPKRVISTPISEAAMAGVGTGLAMKGLRPIVEIMFGDFIALCTDQIVNGATKFSWMYGDKFDVPLTIRTPMGGGRGYGATHSQTLETLFMGVPGINIIGPSIYHDAGQLLIDVVKNSKCPTLFVENKTLYPQLLQAPDSKMKIVL
jgi:pyruvate/2-oxoglutarate/acetoin dehydrogenase E1 component